MSSSSVSLARSKSSSKVRISGSRRLRRTSWSERRPCCMPSTQRLMSESTQSTLGIFTCAASAYAFDDPHQFDDSLAVLACEAHEVAHSCNGVAARLPPALRSRARIPSLPPFTAHSKLPGFAGAPAGRSFSVAPSSRSWSCGSSRSYRTLRLKRPGGRREFSCRSPPWCRLRAGFLARPRAPAAAPPTSSRPSRGRRLCAFCAFPPAPPHCRRKETGPA